MPTPTLLTLGLTLLLTGCGIDAGIPVPNTIAFEESLSTYDIYQGNMGDLTPSADYQLLELGSTLYSDYSKKQRLVYIPDGKQITQIDNGIPQFPEGTILVKTFYFPVDARDTALGKQVMETRLEILADGEWNVGTYVWNEEQTEAELALKGVNTTVSWVDSNGTEQTFDYHYPSQKECIACHQLNESVTPIGPSLRNLNIDIETADGTINQLTALQDNGLLTEVDVSTVSSIPDYHDEDLSVEERGRAYLDMNCAHCHQPNAWEESSQKRFEFRYETSLSETNIKDKSEDIRRVFQDGEMPYLGTSVVHEEGWEIVRDYLDSL